MERNWTTFGLKALGPHKAQVQVQVQQSVKVFVLRHWSIEKKSGVIVSRRPHFQTHICSHTSPHKITAFDAMCFAGLQYNGEKKFNPSSIQVCCNDGRAFLNAEYFYFYALNDTY